MVIIETAIFTRQVQQILTNKEYLDLQAFLVNRPDAGPVIVGSGGLRKVRWGLRGKGKRGGARVIYYWAGVQEQLLMLLIYPKSEKDDLTPAQLETLRNIVKKEYP
jgi:hypothetical protein